MTCPKCGQPTSVYKTYAKRDGSIVRYRLCRADGCWLKLKTTERPIPSDDFCWPVIRCPRSSKFTQVG